MNLWQINLTEIPKTIFKLRALKRGFEIFWLIKLLLGFGMFLATIAGAQIWVCRLTHPHAEILECLRR